MIMKQYDKFIEVKILEALERRIRNYHPKKEIIIRDLKKKKSEVAGEKEIEYPLGFLNPDKFLILHNLRLQDENGNFQIDTLILTERYYIILEVKNWQGTVLFDENGQVIRKRSIEEEEGFPNPISQVKTQTFRLQKWLRMHNFPELKIESFVVISFPSTIIKPVQPTIQIPEQVIHNNQLYFKIMELEKNKYPHQTTMNMLMDISQQLIELHTPPIINLFHKYKLNRSDLNFGVRCPECRSLPMIRLKQKWHCTPCGIFSRSAHRSALEDYRLLIGNTITNKQAREFLLVESPDVIRRILLKEKLIQRGNTKSSIYMWES
ncbi:nuclease-related domain-containing protein [Oceanobacillus rekensis]|uniref:nuclease-related domain-containing protein n=1 Tax=Oceanobacillus rekensis TaxID=937927 RepID=UPI001592DA5C|nr:nuclease-related domain-containing protein [Oceanobacillus rekensis]